MNYYSIRERAIKAGINPRQASRVVKKLGVGCKVSGGRIILLSDREWLQVLCYIDRRDHGIKETDV